MRCAGVADGCAGELFKLLFTKQKIDRLQMDMTEFCSEKIDLIIQTLGSRQNKIFAIELPKMELSEQRRELIFFLSRRVKIIGLSAEDSLPQKRKRQDEVEADLKRQKV